MGDEKRDSHYWRKRAEQARAKADAATNNDLRAIYAGQARSYEKLAEAQERMESGKGENLMG